MRRSCIELKSLIPIEHPFSCSTTKSKNESVLIKCCNAPDMCNQELPLDLQLKPGRSDMEVVPSMYQLTTAQCFCHPAARRSRPTPGDYVFGTGLVFGARLHGYLNYLFFLF